MTKTTRERLEEAYLEALTDSALITMKLNHTISDLTDEEFGSLLNEYQDQLCNMKSVTTMTDQEIHASIVTLIMMQV